MAIVGASGRSTMMFEYLKDRPEEGFVTGVYDPLVERSRFLIDAYGPPEAVAYESVEQAVADPRASAAFVASWDAAHYGLASAPARPGRELLPVFWGRSAPACSRGCSSQTSYLWQGQSVWEGSSAS